MDYSTLATYLIALNTWMSAAHTIPCRPTLVVMKSQDNNETLYGIQCDWLFEILQCNNFLLYKFFNQQRLNLDLYRT